jgi:hypothetical protein
MHVKMKSMSKKTLHRITRHQGIRSARRKANGLTAKWLLAQRSVVFRIHHTKRKNKLTPKQRGLEPHVNEVSTKVSLSISNLNIAKEHGYMPRVSKKKKEVVERTFDGYTCKERRMIARALDKAYKLVA